VQNLVSKQMLFLDGETHGKMQLIILKCLSQMVKDLPRSIRSVAHHALASVKEKGEMDLVRDFASTVSLQVIAQVLGIPLSDQGEITQLEAWSDTFADITSG
jgi:cytochrome P450